MAERISFDRVADVYDETRGLPPTPLAKAVGVLAEELQGKRVLEIGVGTGRYAVPLQKSGIRVVGVDIAPKMVERGLAKGLRDVVFADGARLPFRDGSFDAATSNHVLHLVPDWRGGLRGGGGGPPPRGVHARGPGPRGPRSEAVRVPVEGPRGSARAGDVRAAAGVRRAGPGPELRS